MAKYHIGENGPARCKAFVRACPIGGDHFEDEAEANREYARLMRVQYNELESVRKAAHAATVAEQVASIIGKTKGEMLSMVPVMNLRPGDVLPDGRVVNSVEDERWMNIAGREHEGIGVYFKNEYSEFPPGFSYDHFPADSSNIDDVNRDASYTNVFRPAVAKREKLKTLGLETKDDVSVEDLLPGDELPDGRVVKEVDNMRDVGLKWVTLYFEPEEEDGAGDTAEFSLDTRFDSVFLLQKRGMGNA